jgi:hypothetical protein
MACPFNGKLTLNNKKTSFVLISKISIKLIFLEKLVILKNEVTNYYKSSVFSKKFEE